MLGSGPLGRLALGQLEAVPEGVALGAIIELNLTIEAGTAIGEGQQPPVFVGRYHRRRQDARAPGALIELNVSLLPGRVTATVSGVAGGSVIRFRAGIVEAGAATGFDGIAHDNDLLLLDAA